MTSLPFLKCTQLVGGEASLSVTSQLIRRKTYQGLIDFDNHLDDITLDWLNGAINDAVSVEPSWLVRKIQNLIEIYGITPSRVSFSGLSIESDCLTGKIDGLCFPEILYIDEVFDGHIWRDVWMQW